MPFEHPSVSIDIKDVDRSGQLLPLLPLLPPLP
jgi:hypothetical protein